MSKVQLSGKLISRGNQEIKSLVVFLPLIELNNYVDTTNIYKGLEIFFQAARNTNNKKKVVEVERDIKSEVSNGGLVSPLSLTVVISGSVQEREKRGSLEITYDSSEAFVIDNLLTYNAILNLLGIKAPLFTSRLSSVELEKNSVCRQQLAIEELVLTVIFEEQGLNEDQVRKLFFKSLRRYPELHLTQFSGKDIFPLQEVTRILSHDLDLPSFGGVSKKAKHVRSDEGYITTEYILFKVIVGAIAGEKLQEYAKMSDEVTLEDGTPIVTVFYKTYKLYIEAFFRGWLSHMNDTPNAGRKGFRLSAQIWQALSLVIHDLVSEGATVEFVASVGINLGKLDYSKQASHWRNCDVMDLDSNGRLFKSAVKSTREFRRGLKDYFLTFGHK